MEEQRKIVCKKSNVYIFLKKHRKCIKKKAVFLFNSLRVLNTSCNVHACMQAMLFGASDAHSMDTKMQVTVAFNHFGKRLVQRMPRCRFGYIHVVNNDYTHWNMYAVGGSMNPTIISQGNRYIAPPDNGYAKEVSTRDPLFQNVVLYSTCHRLI